jgi:hypothetical protein
MMSPDQMRTTLLLDDDVRAAARVLARQALVAPAENCSGAIPATPTARVPPRWRCTTAAPW